MPLSDLRRGVPVPLSGTAYDRQDSALQRPRVHGKFLYVGDEKLWVRGVTYGAFRPDADGAEYHDAELIDRDFAQMAATGFNAVRIPHTVPPRSLLDAAERHGLRVMVGLSAEQYVGYLIDKRDAPDIAEVIRAKVRSCAGHPALLCYALGNEIPAATVRWLGSRRVERYLERLYRTVKDEDPGALVTYVNYPTTEYLDLPFLDLLCFNVYLEDQERFSAYLRRLQNLAGERPLIMSEVGLDSLRHGETRQAEVLDWQVRASFAAGAAGAFVFAWTDEWYRAGAEVEDWAFGLTDRDRRPKPALAAVRDAFADVPFGKHLAWPRISVVVCSYNGARTLRECLQGLAEVEYPDFEVIVVNDGSTDATPRIAQKFGGRVITTENRGLSSARNTGLAAASGDIVAYIDDDASPDPHWLTYLAATFLTTAHAAVGGPNIPPRGDGLVADCVASSPGGPAHVLIDDTEAEHIPGCNMAFWKRALEAIGGFDPQFRTAGDDVDVCWRLQERGWTIGFHAAAVVWHRRRNSVRAFWKQQRGYGKSEALLERKWPQKYNTAGHATWAGRIYGGTLAQTLGWRRDRIYQGTWGSAPFQSRRTPTPGMLSSLTMMPEWFLVIVALGALSGLGILWSPVLWTLPLFGAAAGVPLVRSAVGGARVSASYPSTSRRRRLEAWLVTTVLHLIQPAARLVGRLTSGLTPWRSTTGPWWSWPRRRTVAVWTERSRTADDRLRSIAAALRTERFPVLTGGDYDRWDLEVKPGILGGARMLLALEDHGAGTQYVRFGVWPRCSRAALALLPLFGGLAAWAAADGAWAAAATLGVATLLIALRMLAECAGGTSAMLRAGAAQEAERPV